MFKDVRRCSARRASRICGFNPHKNQTTCIYMNNVSTAQKDKYVAATDCEKNQNSARKII